MNMVAISGLAGLVCLSALSTAVLLSERVSLDARMIVLAINLATWAICGAIFRCRSV